MRIRAAMWAVAVVTALTACGPSEDTAPPPASQSGAPRLPLADCDASTPVGDLDRSAYGLRFAHGILQTKVEPSHGSTQCVEFTRWGNAAVEVPPDTLLFTFSGGNGEGGQVEFLASALTGGRVPGAPPAPKLTGPISAKVGVSIGGTYYAATTCSLTLTQVGEKGAAGRFDCPDALVDAANPFAPSDDVPYDEDTAPTTTRTARLSGRFEVQP